MRLPDPDFSLSPITGYTRAHWEAAADGLLAGVRPYFDASGALVRLPGRASASGRESDGLEGFARTFLLAAIRVAGAGGHDPDGLLAPYADGLKAGPRGAWLPITDRAQPMVESASIAIALHLTKPWLWDKLDLETRERLADWLADALTHRPVDNNWMLFPLPVADFLAAAGVPHDDAAVERGLARLEDFYVGGGWYRDGERRSFDHYNGWALHLYPNLRLHLNGFVASSTSSARTAPGTSPTTSAPSPGSATQPPGSDGPDAVHTPGGREPGTSATTPASDTSGGLWTAPLAPTPNNSVLPNSAITATSGGPEPSTPSETSENSTAASGRLRSGGTGAPSSAAEPGRSASSVPRGETIAPVSHPLAREARTNTPGTLPAPPVPSLPFGSRADDRYRSRLREFLFAYAEWFGADGAPIHFGRSLTYRMAAAAPLWLGELVDATPLTPGRTRRLASGALRYFLERGAVSDDGLLTMGWHGAHEPTLQWYSGAASPYWASKGFLGLLLPPDHPVWTSVEEDGPDEATRVLPEPGLLVHRHGGIARLLNHGSDDIPWTAPPPGDPHPEGDDPLYARLAYSTVTGPTRTTEVPDNHFGLLLNGRLTSRGPITPVTSATLSGSLPHSTMDDVPPANETGSSASSDNSSADGSVDPPDKLHPRADPASPELEEAASRMAEGATATHGASLSSVHVPQLDGAPVPGARIVSTSSIVHGREVRTHVVWADPGTVVRQTGWAIPVGESGMKLEPSSGPVEIAKGNLVSRLNPVCGWSHGGTLDAPGGTAYGPHAVVPYLEGVVRESPATFVCEVELHDVRFGENEHKRSKGA